VPGMWGNVAAAPRVPKLYNYRSRWDSEHGSAENRDFDGVFEWTPRASRPKMGAAFQQLTPRANFGIWAGPETVFVVNDNGGRCFDFAKLNPGETWVTREALTQIGINNPPLNAAAGQDRRALASIKPTDVMVLGIHAWPAGIIYSPLDVNGRAALYSIGLYDAARCCCAAGY